MQNRFSLLRGLAFAGLAALGFAAAPAYADWTVGDGQKMHFPQMPDMTGFDVNMRTPATLADDWKCTETGPVRDIHFWFSARGDWLNLGLPLDGQIFNIHVSIHANIPAGVGGVPFSRPGQLLWQRDYNVGQVKIRRDGAGPQFWYDPATGLVVVGDHDNVYQCNITDIVEPFYQKKGNIYWLDISISSLQELGWKSSDRNQYPAPYTGLHFEDDAVWNSAGGGWQEIHYPTGPYIGQSMDLAFVITGTKDTWHHKMHFPQEPDPTGADILFSGPPRVLADDWRCSESGPVNDIHVWFSAYSDWLDLTQPLSQQIFNIHVSIHADIPDPDGQGPLYSQPGALLWERDYPADGVRITRCYTEGQDWYDPAQGFYAQLNHRILYRFDIDDIVDPFIQEIGRVYWLDVWMASEGPLGWKTADLDQYPPPLTGIHFLDDGVWGDNPNPLWRELRWPTGPNEGQSIDLAFVITRPTPTGVGHDVPDSYHLEQNYPNPFNPSTTIRYSLPARSSVELAVFGVDGRLVRLLEKSEKPMGIHDATWDGRDASGSPAASGVYFYRLKAGSFTETRKMVLMK